MGWLDKYQDGGVIEDDRGQWAHPGEITRINSNRITMQGVPFPVYGISDKGDKKMMLPGGEYKFNGNNVTEYPIAQNGGYIKGQRTPEERFAWNEKASGRAELTDSPVDWIIGAKGAGSLLTGMGKRMAASADPVIQYGAMMLNRMGYGLAGTLGVQRLDQMGAANPLKPFHWDETEESRQPEIIELNWAKPQVKYQDGGKIIKGWMDKY